MYLISVKCVQTKFGFQAAQKILFSTKRKAAWEIVWKSTSFVDGLNKIHPTWKSTLVHVIYQDKVVLKDILFEHFKETILFFKARVYKANCMFQATTKTLQN